MAGRPDFSPTAVDVYLKPDWAAHEGDDKERYAEDNNVAFGNSAHVAYTVPAGSTLYITNMSYFARASAAANGDLPQICAGVIRNQTDGDNLAFDGGNGGGSITFRKPIVIDGGDEVRVMIYVFANHACNVAVSAQGYEA